MLNANEGNMMKTVTKRSFVNITPRVELLASPLGNSKTINNPMIPKAIDEQINIRVAVFCMVLVYHIKTLPFSLHISAKKNTFLGL